VPLPESWIPSCANGECGGGCRQIKDHDKNKTRENTKGLRHFEQREMVL